MVRKITARTRAPPARPRRMYVPARRVVTYTLRNPRTYIRRRARQGRSLALAARLRRRA